MEYTSEHASRALELMRRLSPLVPDRQEYRDLISILDSPIRWKEAHDQFTKIRSSITLPFEQSNKSGAEVCFAYLAENAAKVAYNCSGEAASFDEDSFDWLIRLEAEFLTASKKQAIQSPQPTAVNRRG